MTRLLSLYNHWVEAEPGSPEERLALAKFRQEVNRRTDPLRMAVSYARIKVGIDVEAGTDLAYIGTDSAETSTLRED